jgi:hypothetical protein
MFTDQEAAVVGFALQELQRSIDNGDSEVKRELVEAAGFGELDPLDVLQTLTENY